METLRPACFVLMPFGTKKDPAGGAAIDFDRIYNDAIRPAIEAAGMDSIRADEERTGGIIHTAMFERLVLCDYAIADLTTANANVFYELGVRHAARPSTTLTIFARQQNLPFDVNYLRSVPYDLAEGNVFGPEEAGALKASITGRLEDLKAVSHQTDQPDSPIFQLLADYPAPDISRLKTDLFREQLDATAGVQRDLADARDEEDASALRAIGESIDPRTAEAGTLVDLFLSFRALSLWDDMVALYERLPRALQRTVMLREQLGMALNRQGKPKKAIRVLEKVLEEHGPSSETYGILGRVYKDQWKGALEAGKPEAIVKGLLAKAIDTYVRGFEADSRDAYPGINAVTLLDIQGDEARRDDILPVVRFAAKKRLGENPDYWDHATMLELAVLANDTDAAQESLQTALSEVREPWEPVTTANNLELIRTARTARGASEPWLDAIIEALRAGPI